MRRHGKHIYAHSLNVYGYVAYGLHGVGMEQHAPLMANGGYLLYGHYCADFVVRGHHAYKYRLIRYGVAHLLRRDQPILIDGKIGHPEAPLFKRGAGVQYRVMLNICCDYMVALFSVPFSRAEKHRIVAFRAAAGENYLTRLGVYGLGHLLARMLNACPRRLAEGVRA